MRKAAVLFLFLGLFFAGYARARQPQTLADVLAMNEIPAASVSAPSHLDDEITSYATLNTDREFAIAYYLGNPEGELRFPLLLARLDKEAGKWQEASLTDLKVKAFAGLEGQDDCIGSAERIQTNGDWYYIDLHMGPSAGCLIVLNHDLSVHETLTGWSMAHFKSGLVVYEGSMIHFSPIEPMTLFVYDPVANRSETIYPQKNDPLRKAFSEYLKGLINDEICRENNWRCDPNEFESLISPVEINDETRSLAFEVHFDTRGFLRPKDAEPRWDNGKVETAESRVKWTYVYVYELMPLRWRAFRLSDLKSEFGTDSLKDMLKHSKLDQVFATPAPN
jgi:hypothetical protein